jgi:hypothetical protein
MRIRFYIDPETGMLHIYRHEVREDQAEDIRANSEENRPGKKVR